jgi:probable phosphoglycerate mutase
MSVNIDLKKHLPPDQLRKRIYLIRHGETDYNRMGWVQGSGIDADLNAFGRLQAKRFYEYFGNMPFSRVYTSALKRTHQSVADFINNGIPHTILTGLNEISWGFNEGKPITSDSNRVFHSTVRRWNAGETNLKLPGGESPEEVLKRMTPAINAILTAEGEEQILICMHGRAMRILLCHLFKKSLQEMDRFHHTNLCLYVLGYDGENFYLELENYTEHLKNLNEENLEDL